MSSDDAHLSIDQIADLGADAMPPAEVPAAQAHLRTCDECRATHDLLAGIPALLANVASPPVPDGVTARVVAAIEREQIARAGEADELASLDAARARSSRAGARRRFTARLGAGLLGTAAALGVGFVVVTSGLGGGDSEDGPTAADADSNEESARDTGGSAPTAALADGRSYTAASLDDDVRQLLEISEYSARTTGPDVLGEDGQVGEPDDALVKACIAATQRHAGSEADPAAVDIGTYDGVPAVVVVLPEGTSAATTEAYDVWVVGESCLSSDDGGGVEFDVGELDVLDHKSVPR